MNNKIEMAEYISKNRVKDFIHAVNSVKGFTSYEDYTWLMNAIIDSTAADVQPVKRGRWIYDEKPEFGNPYGSYICSECKHRVAHKENFCPNCGARMED